jgi:3-phosphoshikimate 1-carboxyvinyltransferase
MLKLFGADINTDGLKVTLNSGSKPLTAPKKNIFIPGDISSAAFFIALGLILEGSEIILRSVGINPTRRGIIDCLLRMGADIKIEGEKFAFEPFCDLRVRGGRLKATKVTAEEIPFLIDEIPVLTVCAALADGTTEIQGVGELRVKETDRVQSMISNLKKLGVDIWAEGDTLFIKGKPGRFDGAGQEFESFADHRTAMSMVVATCAASGECLIKDVDCIKTSFPDFFELLERIRSRA